MNFNTIVERSENDIEINNTGESSLDTIPEESGADEIFDDFGLPPTDESIDEFKDEDDELDTTHHVGVSNLPDSSKDKIPRSDKPQFECKLCGKIYKTERYYRKHIEVCKGSKTTSEPIKIEKVPNKDPTSVDDLLAKKKRQKSIANMCMVGLRYLCNYAESVSLRLNGCYERIIDVKGKIYQNHFEKIISYHGLDEISEVVEGLDNPYTGLCIDLAQDWMEITKSTQSQSS